MTETPTIARKRAASRNFIAAMSTLQRDVARRAAEQRLANHPVVRANKAAEGRDFATEINVENSAPVKHLRVVRDDYDREGIDGWKPEYDSGN